MSDIAANNKRLAKNSMMLYLRMIFSMLISLYTARIVLKELGFVDYGVYGLVASVTTTLAFLNSSMAGATSRFLTFELGRKDYQKLHNTFSLTFWIHLALAVIVALATEALVSWLLYTTLNVPDDRMYAAGWVLQTSILTLFLGIVQVPFSSSIISHERLGVFAYIEMGQSAAKLLIALALPYIVHDRLITYSILMMLISVVVFLYTVFYAVKRFLECHPKRFWDKTLFSQLMSFSSWELLSGLTGSARGQGVGALINIFWGAAVNAAYGLAWSVQNMVSLFATNITTAIRPQIVKYYAQEDYNQMVNLSHNAIKLISLVLAFIILPLITEMNFILDLWLDKVPEFADIFAQLTLVYCWIWTTTSVLVIGIQATGRIRNYTLYNSIFDALILAIAYIGLYLKIGPWTVFLAYIIGGLCSLSAAAFLLNKMLPRFKISIFIFRDLLPNWVTFAAVFVLCMFIHQHMEEGWTRLITISICSTALLSLIGFYVLLPISFRNKVIAVVRQRLPFGK